MDKNAYLEVNASQKPAIELLQAMGYTYISPENCEKQRGSRYHVLLKDVLRGQLRRLNRYTYAGVENEFSAANIERAIKRGSGEGEQVHYDQITYEGHGAGGVAIMIETLTDNRNRTVASVRSMLSKNGGQMGEAGCVAWQFKTLGQIEVEGDDLDQDELMMAALDAGADDVSEDGTIYTAPAEVSNVAKKLEEAGYKIESMEIAKVPQNLLAVDEKTAASILKLCSVLEDDDDVQNVYTNADISDEIMEKLG